jgi:hypothetical protein
MRKRLRKKLGLPRPTARLRRLRNVDEVIRASEDRRCAETYRVLARLATLGSMHGYAAMETTRNDDGTFTRRITAPTFLYRT